MDSISVYVLIPFISFIVNLILTVYIFAQRREGEINRAYFFYSLSLTGWSLLDFLLWTHLFEPWQDIMVKAGAIFWHTTPFSFLNFVYIFLRRKIDTLYKTFFYIIVASLILTWSTDWVIVGTRDVAIAVLDKPGFLHTPVTFIAGMLPIVVGLVLMFAKAGEHDGQQKRAQIVWVATGTLIGMAMTISTMVIIPDVLRIDGVLPLNDVAFLINSIMIFIAIRNFNFLTLQVSDVADELFSSMSDGIIILGENEQVQHVNIAAINMLDINPAAMRQPAFNISKYFDDFPIADKVFNHCELSAKREDEIHYFDVSRAHVVQHDDEDAYIITISDITRRKQAELDLMSVIQEVEDARDQALEANRMKSQFLANMSHELRTPLNAVIGYSEMISEEADDIGEQQIAKDANKINAAGKHLLSLINDILDLSKIEAGKMQLYIERFNVKSMLDDIVSVVEPLIKTNSNTLEVEIISPELMMESDQTKVRQIIFNFISNAAKFTEHGKIKLKVTVDNAMIRFAVEDNGIGIPQEKIASLFDAFTQADASTTRKYGGTGLGLAICSNFAQMMGGEVAVHSEEGVGSEFSVTLPLHTRVETTEAANPLQAEIDRAVEAKGRDEDAAKHEGRRKKVSKVLVIDDDPNVCELVSRVLSKSGFNVLIANNGEQGLSMARSEQPDVITLDVMMPNMDGWGVLHEIRKDEALREIPVIMLSMVDDKDVGFALGATEYMIKPVNNELLLGMVKKCVRKSEAYVLIVEDDLAAQSLAEANLLKQGFRVAVANNGHEALDRIHEEIPDLIISDLMMPVMDGFDLIKYLRSDEQYKDIPIIVLSAMELTQDERQNLSQLVQEIISKNSISMEEMVARVRSSLSDGGE